MEMDGRTEEEHSQMANAHRAGNNNGDGDTVGKCTSGAVQLRGAIKAVHRIHNNQIGNRIEEMELVKEVGL